MNKDRVERQVGEWTGDSEAQVKGAAKQAEGKVQNAWGKAKDAVKQSNDNVKGNERADEAPDVDDEESTPRRRAS
jgi:uncharacterized protein YjbJ (UPF0337 family)